MNDLQVFNNPEFGEIRTVTIESEVWFVGRDVGLILGYNEPHKAIPRHVDSEDGMKRPIPSVSGAQETWLVNESGLYSLILSSKLPTAKKFKRWVTSEVLPSIRKHGAYMTPATLEDAILNPDGAIRLLTALKDEQAKSRQLEAVNAELAPKAAYADRVLSCKDLFTITQIAKDYGMSGVQFNKLLRGLGVQYPQNGQWLLYAKHQNKGYTHSETIEYTRSDGTISTKMNTKWTQAGRQFLYELLKKKRILPQIEQATA